MRKLIIILLVAICGTAKAQTVIQPCLPVSTLSTYPFGTYTYISGVDSVTLTIVSAVPVCPTCPVCKIYTHADTLAIQALKICPKQRTAISYTYDKATGKSTFKYDDGSVSLRRTK
jgi:hypothetical protein